MTVFGTREGPATLAAVIAAIVLLFAFTGTLAKIWNRQRLDRASEQFQTGEQLARMGQHEEAIQHYLAALTLSRDNTQYELALALTLVKLDRLTQAEAYLAETLAADPTNAAANLSLARIAAGRNNMNDAVLYYHRAVYGLWADTPVDHRLQARLELADYLVSRGQTRAAVAELVAVESDTPADHALHMTLATRYLKYRVPDQAAAQFRDAAAEKKDDPAAWTGLAEAEMAAGNYGAAEKAFQQAVRYDPRNKTLQARLSLAEDVTELDPSVRLLGTVEQYKRSRALLQRASSALTACTQDLPRLPVEAQAAENASRGLLDHPARRPVIDDVNKNLGVVAALWKQRLAVCPKTPVKDDALSMVMGRLAR